MHGLRWLNKHLWRFATGLSRHTQWKEKKKKNSFSNYLTGSENGKANHSCHSFMQLDPLTMGNIETMQTWEACYHSQKTDWNRLQGNFPAHRASAHLVSSNPANNPCQQVVLNTCLHLGKWRNAAAKPWSTARCGGCWSHRSQRVDVLNCLSIQLQPCF